MSAATTTASANPGVMSSDSFAAMFEESLARQEMRTGEMITAEVVRVDYNMVVVNAGLKSESFIPIEEFKNDKGEVEVKVGDFVTVAIEKFEDGFGATKLIRDEERHADWFEAQLAAIEAVGESAYLARQIDPGTAPA